MIISKNENWFLITNKDKNTISFNTKTESDLNIFSFEKKKPWKIFFDQEWEYEAFWIEVKWYAMWENLNSWFLLKTDWKKVFLLDEKISNFNEKILGDIEEPDVLIVNIPNNSENLDLVKNIVEKISAKIIIFSWDLEKIKKKFEKIEVSNEEIKIWTIPDNTEFFYI